MTVPTKAPQAVDSSVVSVRVLKHGDGKISTGQAGDYGKGDIHYARNDEFQVGRARADELEAVHYVEIV